MTTFLLLIIYLMFIGLGIPDSLLGPAWPAIYPSFGVGVSTASLITLTISGCTVLSSLASTKLIRRFGTAKVTAICTAMTAAALFGYSISPNLFCLWLFSIPLGLGAGSIDAGLNNFVALHYKATHMNFLHCFYGIGVSLSPYLMSVALRSHTWRFGYQMAFALQTVLALIAIGSIPLWRKANFQEGQGAAEGQESEVAIKELLKMPAMRCAALYFLTACALEITCGTWCSTYLVAAKGLAADAAARYALCFYLGMALGRFVSGLLANRLSPWSLIRLGTGITFAAVLLLLLPLPISFSVLALFLAWFGIGPLYPNMTHLTPSNFGAAASQTAISIQMAGCYVGSMAAPAVFGWIAQGFSAGYLPVYLMALFAALTLSLQALLRSLKKAGRYPSA